MGPFYPGQFWSYWPTKMPKKIQVVVNEVSGL